MSMRYKGGVLSATAPVTSSSSAKGIWSMRQQLQAVGGTGWPTPPPVFPNIGAPYGGGFIGGKINVSGTQYYLIVAPKAFGQSSQTWGTYGVTTGITNVIAGPTNTTSLAALGSSYAAATFCENLTIGAYSDWYMPALNELEVLCYFLKPTTINNDTTSGSNANAVSPEPISTNYTTTTPSQTPAIDFQVGGNEAFDSSISTYSCSTESNAVSALGIEFGDPAGWGYGHKVSSYKFSSLYVRAVRRVPV